MSMQRAALRVATVLALSNYYTAPFPTMAHARVFDARIDPLPGTDPKDLIPSISVYTDDDVGEPLSTNNGGPPFRRFVTLTLWLTLGQLGEYDEATGEAGIVLPVTDAQTEGLLDLFEYQVRFAFARFDNQWSRLMRGFYTRCTTWKSNRTATAQNVRLAARQLTATIELKDDDVIPLVQVAPVGPLPEPPVPEDEPLPDCIQELLETVQV